MGFYVVMGTVLIVPAVLDIMLDESLLVIARDLVVPLFCGVLAILCVIDDNKLNKEEEAFRAREMNEKVAEEREHFKATWKARVAKSRKLHRELQWLKKYGWSKRTKILTN